MIGMTQTAALVYATRSIRLNIV
ncbi:hypothetical protein [Pseudomonas sp. H3_E04]